MRVFSFGTLREFWTDHADAEDALREWYRDACRAHWASPQEIRNTYATASFFSENRVVFNIRGNHYRLVVRVYYRWSTIYVRFIGTHAEYDRINAETI
jgi:mRNA interferase HigB